MFLNNRYHDPTLGIFISVDPLVQATGEPYIYAGGNPTTLSDPTGLYKAGDDPDDCRPNCRPMLGPPAPPQVYGPPAPTGAVGSPSGPSTTCVAACLTSGASASRPSNWNVLPQVFEATWDYPLELELNLDLCPAMACDLIVVPVFSGGDLGAAATVSAPYAVPQNQFTWTFSLGVSTAEAFFFRRIPADMPSRIAAGDGEFRLRTNEYFGSRADASSISTGAYLWDVPARVEVTPNIANAGDALGLETATGYFVVVMYNNGSEAVGWDGGLGINPFTVDIPAAYLAARSS